MNEAKVLLGNLYQEKTLFMVKKIKSLKIRADEISLKDAEHFDSFATAVFNCQIKY